ncbi:hypothetical protein, partial [Prevotella sp.]|uniref:hypothetical protein n=1 Tax=Prevotella sp. TaxID=59823 RepID=UPI0027E250E3
ITTRTADVLIIGHLLFEYIYVVIAILHYFSRLYATNLAKIYGITKYKKTYRPTILEELVVGAY